MKKKNSQINLASIYREMSEETLNKEIDAFFDIGFALLEASESDSIEMYPNPNIKLVFSCEVIKDTNGKYFN